MDHAVYPIEQVREEVKRALALGGSREAAERTAAQSLCIPVEAVREALALQHEGDE
jgi:hypothetical protein